MDREVKCPKCLKTIGKIIHEGYTDCGKLGAIELCRTELDYRKASHVWWREKGKSGNLCKTCARPIFPEGKYYLIKKMIHGKPSCIYGGVNGSEYYTTKKDADEKAKQMHERFGDYHWVEEKRL